MNLFRKSFRPFTACALLAVRNERCYITRCIRHLAEQGLQICVIDNDSTDGTSDMVKAFSPEIVIRYVRHPYLGHFDLVSQLQLKQELAAKIDADFFLHCDADEILKPPAPFSTLVEAFQHVVKEGYNAVNFDEFVFVPFNDDDLGDGVDYVEAIRYYYFFEPKPERLIRGWKKTRRRIDLASFGGHRAGFSRMRVYPKPFILQHYIALSRKSLVNKYSSRVFSPKELKMGWHRNRIGVTEESTQFPEKSDLCLYREDGVWDKTNPWRKHFFDRE